MPKIGENVGGLILNEKIEGGELKDKYNLPLRWQITDIRWVLKEGQVVPIMHVVGKWGRVLGDLAVVMMAVDWIWPWCVQ